MCQVGNTDRTVRSTERTMHRSADEPAAKQGEGRGTFVGWERRKRTFRQTRTNHRNRQSVCQCHVRIRRPDFSCRNDTFRGTISATRTCYHSAKFVQPGTKVDRTGRGPARHDSNRPGFPSRLYRGFAINKTQTIRSGSGVSSLPQKRRQTVFDAPLENLSPLPWKSLMYPRWGASHIPHRPEFRFADGPQE